MKQENFTDIEYRARKKKSKREEFLKTIDEIIPQEEWVNTIAPYHPQREARPPSYGDRENAADVPASDMIQLVRPGDGGH